MSQRSIGDQGYVVDDQFTYFITTDKPTFSFLLPQPTKALLGYSIKIEKAFCTYTGTSLTIPYHMILAIDGASGYFNAEASNSEIITFLKPENMVYTGTKLFANFTEKKSEVTHLKQTGGMCKVGFFVPATTMTTDGNGVPTTTYAPATISTTADFQPISVEFTITIYYK